VQIKKIKKKNRKTSEFWGIVGVAAGGHTGDETERLFKNLHTEYHRLKQKMHISGVDTDGPPTLRNSEALFVAYELFYTLFYPQGGSCTKYRNDGDWLPTVS